MKILREVLKERSLIELIELMEFAGRSNRTKFRDQVLRPLLEQHWIEMTVPDKPTSNRQKYRLTASGREILSKYNDGET